MKSINKMIVLGLALFTVLGSTNVFAAENILTSPTVSDGGTYNDPPSRIELSEGLATLFPFGAPGAKQGYGMDTRAAWLTPMENNVQAILQGGFLYYNQGVPGSAGWGYTSPTDVYLGGGLRETSTWGYSLTETLNAGMAIEANNSGPEAFVGIEVRGETPRLMLTPLKLFASVSVDYLGNNGFRNGLPWTSWAVPVEAGVVLAF